MINKSFRTAELIAGYLSGSLTTKEKRELEYWRSSPENEALFQKICDEEQMELHCQSSTRFRPDEGWNKIEKKIERRIRKNYLLAFSRYAAILILPICLLFLIKEPETGNAVSGIAEAIRIEPGEKKAILTLENGETIALNTSHGVLTEKDGTVIHIDSSTLNYTNKQSIAQQQEPIYNKVQVPHGGEYSLYLSDGTKVYLNAMSSLLFPVSFTGETRTVELHGEAYFEVQPHSAPFIVKANGIETTVLGTSFNISAYDGENIETTLVSGSIRVSTAQGASRILHPSQQAIIDPQQQTILVKEVDAIFYTSWIKGKINFKDRPLEEIMKTLSRWYDIETVYASEAVRKMKFGCYVDRYQEIKPFLELLEISGKLHITQNDKTIVINRK